MIRGGPSLAPSGSCSARTMPERDGRWAAQPFGTVRKPFFSLIWTCSERSVRQDATLSGGRIRLPLRLLDALRRAMLGVLHVLTAALGSPLARTCPQSAVVRGYVPVVMRRTAVVMSSTVRESAPAVRGRH